MCDVGEGGSEGGRGGGEDVDACKGYVGAPVRVFWTYIRFSYNTLGLLLRQL